jgi:DNA-binding winged helix-turn-helix (wHTH) protein
MVFRVGTAVIDCDRREVWRNGVDCHVPRKTFDLLRVLLDERPKVVRKDELISRVWPREPRSKPACAPRNLRLLGCAETYVNHEGHEEHEVNISKRQCR